MADPTPSPGAGGVLASFAAKLTEPRGARRIDALLAEDDAQAAVAALTPSEVYELVHEAGFEDSSELIALATPEQLQGCLDFEVWDKDEYLDTAFHPWLNVLFEAGFEKVGEVWAGFDPEARMLWLQRHVQVYDVTMNEGPDDDDDSAFMPTPDSFFILKLLGDDESQRVTMRLVEDLYRADAVLARHTIQGARSEPAADLEEHSYRWRAGRLADLGYVDFHEAIELFHPLELDQLKLDEDDGHSNIIDPLAARSSLAVASEVLARPFLARALAEIEDPAEVARIEGAILYLVNRVLAAARAKPGQPEVVQRAAQFASATLSLGLEAAARGDARRAAGALRKVALPKLFRAGYTLTLKLAKLAIALAPRAAIAEAPLRNVVAALSSPRPLWARAADVPPAPGVRPFESLADLKRGTDALGNLTVRLALAESVGVDLLAQAKQPEPRPTLETHLRTALLRAAATGNWRGGPLPIVALEQLRRTVFLEGALTSLARRRAHDTVAASLGAAQLLAGATALPPILDELLDQIEALLGEIADDELDARFLDGLLIES
jgi:Family of unknown function (DUF6178)